MLETTLGLGKNIKNTKNFPIAKILKALQKKSKFDYLKISMTDYEEELEEMLMENRFIVYKGAYFTCETVYEYKLHIFHM